MTPREQEVEVPCGLEDHPRLLISKTRKLTGSQPGSQKTSWLTSSTELMFLLDPIGVGLSVVVTQKSVSEPMDGSDAIPAEITVHWGGAQE